MARSDAVLLNSLEPLVAALRAEGRAVIGPTVRDGAVVLVEIEAAADLPDGWEVTLSPGRYGLHRRPDRVVFGHTAGPSRGRHGCTRRGSRCGPPAGPRTEP